MSFLAGWEQIYGLLVEDGQIAIGTLLAFVLPPFTRISSATSCAIQPAGYCSPC